jgi:putative membrane protein
MSVSDLPAVNAALNSCSAILLTTGYVFIRKGRVIAHRNCMIAAFVTSCVFLVCYVLHKILMKGVHTPFAGPVALKPFYYTLLISHVLMAMAIVPLAIVTIRRGLRARYELHKKIARWTWPLWMYVSVTGVLIYLLLYQIYPQPGIRRSGDLKAPQPGIVVRSVSGLDRG